MMKTKVFALVLGLIGLLALPLASSAQDESHLAVESGEVEVTSDGQAYQSYLAAPGDDGVYPGIVLIHSFNGLEDGYKTMVDSFAARGFVVLAVGWQTFERQPSDDTVKQLVEDSIAFLSARDDVDPERLGLTGFCAGGRYTMLLLPQLDDQFKAGVAWYGFPYNGDPAPDSFVSELDAPMLIVHGTNDQASAIEDIYRYATDLASHGKDFELKVYSGEPHGFMVQGGAFQTDEIAQDAFNEMIDFFDRKLNLDAM